MEVPYNTLTHFGCTRQAIRCYQHLSESHGMHASELAAALGIKRPQVYPLLKSLQRKGLVETFKIEGWDSTSFQAVPIEKAIDYYLVYLRKMAIPLIQAQRR